MRAGIIGNPFEAMQELGCQWVGEQDWHYRRQFDFTPDPNRPRRVLRFEGLDTLVRVCLNGKLIAEHDNMFVALEIDVSDSLVAGTNELRLEFGSASRACNERREQYFKSAGLAPNTARFEPRAFLRKSQYMFGWDWGPCLISAGIWRPLALLEYRSRIIDVSVVQYHHSDGSVELEFLSAVEGQGNVYHFLEGLDAPIPDGGRLRIEHPRRWWPNGMGAQELYRVTSLLLESPPSDIRHAEPLDRLEQRIGLRSLQLLRQADKFGESFQFSVNGRDLYALGANWIPDDSFPSRVDRARLLRQLTAARDLGMNMLRVWGGGFYECDDFYEICDELGLLVWQDFPYACSYYPDDDAACAVAEREAKAAALRLRNHASLGLWCGNNENLTMRQGGWDGAAQHPARYHGERIYDGVLPELLAQIDPSRPYISTSPIGKHKANSGGDGDQHYWDVWHGRGDWTFYAESDARFCSEFGFASAPSPAVWRSMDPNSELMLAPISDPVARWHDKTGKGFETFVGLVELHYPKSETLADWTYYSQLNQRDALRFGIEHYRRSEFCRGTLIWQLNDCWPVQSWAIIDSAFCWKPAAFELRRLNAPLLLSLVREGDAVHLWGILDNVSHPIDVSLRLVVQSLSDGRALGSRDVCVRLAPGERRVLDTVNIVEFDTRTTMVVAELEGYRCHALLCEPKELNLRPPSELVVYLESGRLIVEAPEPILDLWLYDDSGCCVLTDNFVTFVVPGRHLLRCQGEPRQLVARSLAGFHPLRIET